MSVVLKRISTFPIRFSTGFSVRFLKLRKKKIPLPKEVKFQSQESSLATKGFLRNYKPYTPPEDASEKVAIVCSKYGIETDADHVIEDPAIRFSILKDCFHEFEHSVPNSMLHTIETVGDITNFYITPVNTTVPYDAMKDLDLPENLHIQYDYVRFHPEKDTKFGGKSAFPGSSTLVTGLKAKKKYEGYIARSPWDL